MGILLELLLALAALVAVELGIPTLLEWPLAIVPLVLAPYALARAGRRALLAGRFRASARWISLADRWPLLGYLLALFAFGWHGSVVRWTGSDPTLTNWPGPALLLALAPFLASELVAIDARARGLPARTARALRGFQLRNLGSALAPLALYLVLAGLVGANAPLRVRIEEVGLFGAAFAGLLLVAFALFLPTLLRNTWETEPLADGRERRVLQALALRAGFRCREILVWRTGGLLANAAIVGLTARSRVVLLSDTLLARLELDELAAVFAHEMGHALRRHASVLLAWALALLLAADLAVARLAPDDELVAMAVLAGVLLLWALAFGVLSRRLELDADLTSLELLGDVEPLVRALEKVGGRLRDVAGWRHFSAAKRVDFLRRATREPALVRRLRARLRVVSLLGALALMLVLALQAVRLVGGFPDELLRVDLRLGRYVEAAERARDPARSAGLRALAAHAQALGLAEPEGASTPGGLARGLRADLRAGSLERAGATLELLLLREGLPRAPLEAARERLVAGEPEAAAEALAGFEDDGQ